MPLISITKTLLEGRAKRGDGRMASADSVWTVQLMQKGNNWGNHEPLNGMDAG